MHLPEHSIKGSKSYPGEKEFHLQYSRTANETAFFQLIPYCNLKVSNQSSHWEVESLH